MPIFIFYVIYERMPKIKAYLFATEEECVDFNRTSSTNLMVYGIIIGSLLMLLLGVLIRTGMGPCASSSFPIAMGFGLFLLGMVFLESESSFNGKKYTLRERIGFTSLFLFPALIALISTPLFAIAETAIKTSLLGAVTKIVYTIFDLAGYYIEREGNILILPAGKVGVEEACSGIRSLTASIFSGSFIGAVFLDKLWKKMVLIVCAVVLAFITNILRSIFLTSWAYLYGSDSIGGLIHDIAGYSVLMITCIGLILLLPLFRLSHNS